MTFCLTQKLPQGFTTGYTSPAQIYNPLRVRVDPTTEYSLPVSLSVQEYLSGKSDFIPLKGLTKQGVECLKDIAKLAHPSNRGPLVKSFDDMEQVIAYLMTGNKKPTPKDIDWVYQNAPTLLLPVSKILSEYGGETALTQIVAFVEEAEFVITPPKEKAAPETGHASEGAPLSIPTRNSPEGISSWGIIAGLAAIVGVVVAVPRAWSNMSNMGLTEGIDPFVLKTLRLCGIHPNRPILEEVDGHSGAYLAPDAPMENYISILLANLRTGADSKIPLVICQDRGQKNYFVQKFKEIVNRGRYGFDTPVCRIPMEKLAARSVPEWHESKHEIEKKSKEGAVFAILDSINSRIRSNHLLQRAILKISDPEWRYAYPNVFPLATTTRLDYQQDIQGTELEEEYFRVI